MDNIKTDNFAEDYFEQLEDLLQDAKDAGCPEAMYGLVHAGLEMVAEAMMRSMLAVPESQGEQAAMSSRIYEELLSGIRECVVSLPPEQRAGWIKATK